VDAFYRREAPRLAEALTNLPWAGSGERRDALAAVAEAQRTTCGALDKRRSDAILKWGFGRKSSLSGAQIANATRDAFRRVAAGDETGAIRSLQELPGIGVSRATNILRRARADLGALQVEGDIRERHPASGSNL
jgi:hypothetical protein